MCIIIQTMKIKLKSYGGLGLTPGNNLQNQWEPRRSRQQWIKCSQVAIKYACYRAIEYLWHTLPHDNLISPKIHGANKINNYYTW